jgi:uncharacterized membrane protein
MLNALAQATYTYTTTTTTTTDKGVIAAILTAIAGLMLIIIPLVIFEIVCLWKVFEKAGVEGWKALIPVYNGWVLAEIAGKPGWWALVGVGAVIPVIGFLASIAGVVLFVIISIELAKSFGKNPSFAWLLVLLSVVGMAILAFGDAKYVGAGGKGGAKPAPKTA